MTTDQLKAMDMMINALRNIAVGRIDNGRPLAAETSRQKSRKVLASVGVNWGKDKFENGDANALSQENRAG